MADRIKNLKLSYKIIASTFIISLTLIAGIEFKTQNDIGQLLAEKDKEITEKDMDAVIDKFSVNYSLMSLVLDQIMANDCIITAFAERDRERLIGLTLRVWENMRQEGILQYHFHLPDNKTFLRVHNLEMYGDDLTELRPMLATASRFQIPVEGLEEGKHGVSFRSIRPVYYEGDFIGSIELGMVLDEKNLQALKSLSGGEWYLCSLKNDLLEDAVGTCGACPVGLIDDVHGKIQEGNIRFIEYDMIRAQIIILQDYSDEIKWFLVRVSDNTEILNIRRQQRQSGMLSSFSLAGIGLILMSILLQRLLSPLSYLVENTKAFTHGDLSRSITITREDEIGQLAMSMENMRKAIRDKEAELKYQSLHDQLTGLYNRTYFEQEISRLENGDSYPISMISADMDGLKLINDTMGHKQGDKLLIDCGRILKSALRETDVLARIGGDEFVAILPGTDEEEANKIVAKMRTLVESYNCEHLNMPFSISMGLASSPGTEKTLDETFKEADNRMYKDKLYRSASARGQLVSALLAALAERDYVAEGHADRLQELSLKIGEKIGLPATQLSDLILLAKVHDLGKVGIPDYILYKPDKLTDSEWEIMREHPEKGFRIAQSSPDLASVADLILLHHEKWDGTGYPLKLKGEAIPVECRILAIADAFDAMTNDRPYRQAKSKDEALKEIKEYAGTQFDPYLVEIFLQIIEES